MNTSKPLSTPQISISQVNAATQQLSDVMEMIDLNLIKIKLVEVESDYQKEPSTLNKIRIGIIYHETALNLSFFSKTEYKGYAKQSFECLTECSDSKNTAPCFMPLIVAYRASALALVSAETNNLKALSKAFGLFNVAVEQYGTVCCMPEFLRGSVAENLPWFFFSKRKYAKLDFQHLILKFEANGNYGDWKAISFSYWAWAKQHPGKKNRSKSLSYLNKAIALDPYCQAGRAKAETLKAEFEKK